MHLKPPGFLNLDAVKKVAEKHSRPYWWKEESKVSLFILESKINQYKKFITIFIGKESNQFLVWEENTKTPGFRMLPSRWNDLESAFSDYSRRIRVV